MHGRVPGTISVIPEFRVSELIPEMLMKEGQEVVDHYEDVEKCKRGIAYLFQAGSAGFVREEDVLVKNFEAASAFQDAMLQVWWSQWKAQHSSCPITRGMRARRSTSTCGSGTSACC